MKITTNQYCLVYKNHNGRMTGKPYQGWLYSSIVQANKDAKFFSQGTKKNMKVARLTLETV